MSTGSLILLTVQAICFVVWAVLMFQTIFMLARRARAETGAQIPGPLATLKQWHKWVTSEEDRTARRKLGLATAALVASNLANLLIS